MKRIYTYRYLLYVAIIVFVSAYLILLVYGYRINWQNLSVEKTSVIYVASIPQTVNVYINDRLVSDSTPLRYNYVFPGRYEVRIEHPLYESWVKFFNVKPNIVSQDPDVILILKNKKNIELEEAEIEMYQNMFDDEKTMQKNSFGLTVKNNNELYFEDIFVTRFSQDIKNVIWFIDKKHLLIQLGNKIYFMDSDASNIKALTVLAGDRKADFLSVDDGKHLVYRCDEKIYKIQITNISNLFREKYFNKAVKIIK